MLPLSILYRGGTASGTSCSAEAGEGERASSIREGSLDATWFAVYFFASDVAGDGIACVTIDGLG